ncbi:hypothetical protein [Pseudomonas sp. MF6768]|uniref:hypothetical protein n=1 Tax=Pseudomonas sp. MF6768 TaxID=2797532 RepID=UPI0018E8D381|nr:hypothetical protein [Pseudomonas sp. MF6768]MBJ2241974.1 hypothetical protein [Pseudomonas sp. MF6768]
MDDDSKPTSFTEAVGTTLGQLFVISMYQTRATLNLARAIEKDSSSSQELKSAAKDSLAVIDLIIEKIESAVDDDMVSSIRDFVGKTEDE